eukprot:1256580-Ditylum_brightwellii.AAC.1
MVAVVLAPPPDSYVALYLFKVIKVAVCPAPFLLAIITSGCPRLLASVISPFCFDGLLKLAKESNEL